MERSGSPTDANEGTYPKTQLTVSVITDDWATGNMWKAWDDLRHINRIGGRLSGDVGTDLIKRSV